MFKAIHEWLNRISDTSGPEGGYWADDPRLAAAALLVHLIAVDGEVAEEEREQLRTVLRERYQLSREETETLVAAAKTQDADAVDLYGFTSVLKRNLDERERRAIVEMMWEMSFADGKLSEFEDNMVWRVAELLGIASPDRIAIKKAVEARLESARH